MLLCLSSFSVSPATGQVTREPETLLLRLEIQRLLSYDFEGYLHQDQLYLPAKQLFSILMLPHNYKEAELLLEVFSPASGQNIIIDFKKNRAKGLPPTIGLSADDYILGRGEVYLRRAWLEKALDVTLLFDFRRLSLQLLSSRQFPVMRDYHRRRLSETIAVKNRIPRAEVLQPANRYSLGDLIAHWLSLIHI